MVEVRDLVKRYGDHVAVDHISFKIERGHIYGFLGPNGAGKTTTMNIMTGYIGPTEGEVVVNGHNILEEPEEAKRSIGYLPEHPPLYVDMTPREYLEFAAELKGLRGSKIGTSVDEVMEMVKIADVQDRLIRNLSKGYRQRVGLAQAILGMPEILILDEPTVGLDPKQIHEMRELIRDLAKDRTVILSSHILAEVQETCDRVLIIHRGRLIAAGTPEELEKQMKGAAVELVVKSDSLERVERMLRSVAGADTVTCERTQAEGEISAVVEPRENLDLREAIFHACAREGCPILMMKPYGVSLESVFLELTSDDAAKIGGEAQGEQEQQPETSSGGEAEK